MRPSDNPKTTSYAAVMQRSSARQDMRYIPALDGIRACAALLVVLHHVWLQSWPYNLYPQEVPHGAWKLATGWLAFGKIAVSMFIAVSGFCLMVPVVNNRGKLRGRWSSFLTKRAKRILPPYYAALLLSIGACFLIYPKSHTIFDASLPLTPSGIWSHVFMVHNFSANEYQINGPFWSIAIEFQIYVLFPVVVLAFRKMDIFVVSSGILAISLAVHRFSGITGLDQTTHFLFLFTLGAADALVSHRVGQSGNVDRPSFWCLVAIPISAVVGILGHPLGTNFTDPFVGIATSALLILVSINGQSLLTRFLSLRPLVWLGSFSYSLYLIHFPLIQLFWQITAKELSKQMAFCVDATAGLTVSIAASYGFYLLFEKPFVGTRRTAAESAAVPDLAHAEAMKRPSQRLG